MATELTTHQQAPDQARGHARIALLAYFLLGICFGITLTKSEVLSWFRIQEMFRFQSPRMYEIIASAVLVAAASAAFIKKIGLKTISGVPITIPPKTLGHGVRYPGPLFALAGNGVTVIIVAIASALAGTWTYGWLRPKLPH
jgi:hypothetical protein